MITKISVPDLRDAMVRARGDLRVAAADLGITRDCLQQKLYRAGITRRELYDMRDHVAALPPGDVALTDRGVQLSLADYAVLQTRAAMGLEAERLQNALALADKIIASLTRAVEAHGAQ